MIPTYSFSEISRSSSVWCWTLRPVAGHLKMKCAISQDMTAQALDHDLEQSSASTCHRRSCRDSPVPTGRPPAPHEPDPHQQLSLARRSAF